MPKSSIAIRTPSSCSRQKQAATAFSSCMTTVSVSSRHSADPDSPVSSRTCATASAKSPCRSCSAETFTDTVFGPSSPSSERHATICAHARRRTCRPSCGTRPFSSASSMNSVGGHRAVALVGPAGERLDGGEPRPLAGGGEPDDRLVVHLEGVLLDRPAQVVGQLDALARPGPGLLVEQRPAVLARRLGLVHRDVGVAQDVLGLDVRRPGHDHAEAAGDGDGRAAEQQGRRQRP